MQNERMKDGRPIPLGHMIIGFIVILLGVLLLLETTDIYDTRWILNYFPSLLVVLGVWILIKSRLRSFFGPIVIILVGVAWQLVALDLITSDQVMDYWPIIIIILGIHLLLTRYRTKARESSSEYTSSYAVFGDVEDRNISKNFTGGEMAGVFSDITLDLRGAGVKRPPARVNIGCLFCDIYVIVPPEWNVRIEAVPLISEISDKRRMNDSMHEDIDLIVQGWSAFSDIYIKD